MKDIEQWVDKVWNDCSNDPRTGKPYDYEHQGDCKRAIDDALLKIADMKREDEHEVFDNPTGDMHLELAELEKNLLVKLREVNFMVSHPRDDRTIEVASDETFTDDEVIAAIQGGLESAKEKGVTLDAEQEAFIEDPEQDTDVKRMRDFKRMSSWTDKTDGNS